MPNRDTYLTRKEAAEQLRMSVRSVDRLIASGALRTRRIQSVTGTGTLPRIKQAAIDAYLAGVRA